jgi:hypothetical protein
MNRVGFLLKIGLGLGFGEIGLGFGKIGLGLGWAFLGLFSTLLKIPQLKFICKPITPFKRLSFGHHVNSCYIYAISTIGDSSL